MGKFVIMVMITALVSLMAVYSATTPAHHSDDSASVLEPTIVSHVAPLGANTHCNGEATHAECHATAVLPATGSFAGDHISPNSEFDHRLPVATANPALNLPPPRA